MDYFNYCKQGLWMSLDWQDHWARNLLRLGYELMAWSPCILALGTVVLLTWDLFVRRNPRIACGVQPDRTRPLRLGILVLLALVAGAGYFNFGRFHYQGHPVFLHRWDMMHYYLGSKYFPENGYDRLYLACIAADIEDGKIKPPEFATRKLRRMEDYSIVPVTQVLKDLPEVKARFTPERWRSFKSDLVFFQTLMGDWYRDAVFDHGYNPSPIWNAVGTVLTNHLPPAGPGVAHFIGLLDMGLMTILLLAITWAFGLPAMLVCLIVFSVNYPAQWMWTGGSMLRLDWLVTLGLALCLLKKRRWVLAGACLAYSAGVRGFPLVVLFGPLVLAVEWFWRGLRKPLASGRPDGSPSAGRPLARVKSSILSLPAGLIPARNIPAFRRYGVWTFFISFAVTGLLLGSWACYAAGSWRVWPQWLTKMQLHSQTALTNYMGLPFLMTYDDNRRANLTANDKLPDPFQPWKEKQLETYQRIKPLYYAAVLLALAATALAVRGYPLHVAAAFSVGLIFVCFNLTCYYYSFLALLPLAAGRKRLEWVTIGLLALCAGQFIAIDRMNKLGISWFDQQFAGLSELTLFYLVIAAGVMIAGHGWVRRIWRRAIQRAV